jgi:hypothetical protein
MRRYRETYPLIQAEIELLQAAMFRETAALDLKAAALHKTDPAAAVAMLTNYSVTTGNALVVGAPVRPSKSCGPFSLSPFPPFSFCSKLRLHLTHTCIV